MTRQIANFFLSLFGHQPLSLLWFTSTPAAVLSSTCLCHKVRAKPVVAGRHRFTRVGSTDRARFTAPDLFQAHSGAAFLLPLNLKWLHCSSQLFWPSPVTFTIPRLKDLSFMVINICIRASGRLACIIQTNRFTSGPREGTRGHKGDGVWLTPGCLITSHYCLRQTTTNKIKVNVYSESLQYILHRKCIALLAPNDLAVQLPLNIWTLV